MQHEKVLRLGPLERLESLRRLAERATGIRPTAAAMIAALAEQVTVAWNVTPKMVDHLAHEAAQQELINGCVRWSMRTLGAQASYGEAFKVYRDQAKARGLEPVSLKTFKNRALDSYGEAVELASNIVPFRPAAALRPASPVSEGMAPCA